MKVTTEISASDWWEFCIGKECICQDVDNGRLYLELHGREDSLSKKHYDGEYLNLSFWGEGMPSEPEEEVALDPWFPGNTFEIAGYEWTIEVSE